MRQLNVFICFVLLNSFSLLTFGQTVDTDTIQTCCKINYKHQALIIPATFIGYGIIGIESDKIKSWNSEIQHEFSEHIDKRISIDDFSQYAPAISVFGLEALGVKGKNDFRTKAGILVTSYLIMATAVNGLKYTTKITRPDKSSSNSFPSGHTATAFLGAEFLWQEYKDVSIWYGISGYAIAAGTGFFRMYNERHWLTDVTAGAGIGILSTKIAYWVNPYVTKKLFRNRNTRAKASILPFYSDKQMGISLVINH